MMHEVFASKSQRMERVLDSTLTRLDHGLQKERWHAAICSEQRVSNWRLLLHTLCPPHGRLLV
jgi:hypothetical protein